MTPAPVDLISLADDEGNSVTVTIHGRSPRWAGGLDAAITVNTPFVSGSCYLSLSVRKFASWADALGRLEAGEDVAWMKMDRGATLTLHLTGERDCPEVVVEDESGSMVTVRVPIVPPDDWLADHRERLERVRAHWAPLLAQENP
ncbi:hypothetical protein GCM10010329_31240 [Streptomyces spiroverticillatus]|uniref:Uncharacterized protein n=1 Tax=Streptomyces finlayi TaxID=67296 RepID=A0A918WW92_9ACTN|nr:DUF5959 family protein [Streptomyces finlayi]GHA06419.1 hypothetical protein GCM10010329_31240 [Streptomyces spiroverticillatus]GHC90001.1 hypothetical protein GCM10010334_23650 [Streptomyces finlayi]